MLTDPDRDNQAPDSQDPAPETVPDSGSARTEPAPSQDSSREPAETASEAASTEPPKRKLQLNPTIGVSQVRAIPTIGGSAPPPILEAPPIHDIPVEEPVVEQETKPAYVPPPPPAKPVDIPRREDLDSGLEAQLAAAMSGAAIEQAPPPVHLQESEPDEQPAEPITEDNIPEGASLTGQVLSIHGDDVFLMFPGFQRNGLLSLRQFGERPPAVGQWIQTRVVKVDDENRLILVSLPRGLAKISGDWKAITKGQVVDCMVVKTNKGGLDVNVGSLRGFLPAGQVDLNYVGDLEAFVGQKLRVRITEVNPNRRRLVVSRRQILVEEREVLEKDVYARIAPGQTVTGKVKTIKDYGAFVDIGGVDGLLHVAQISWQRVHNPSEVLTVGQEIEVQILSVDHEKKKIGLGMRQLQKNPWKDAENEFAKGKTLSGKVTRTEAFGAFIEVAPGVEGLVHISELDHKRVGKVTDVLKVGDHVEAQVLEVDPKRKRISLSIKSLIAKPEPEKSELEPEEQKPAFTRQFKGNLKGGIGSSAQGGLFGNPGDYH
jgi:small subunit ribosomal protein S1